MIALALVAALAAADDPRHDEASLEPCKALVTRQELAQASRCFRAHADEREAAAMADVVDAWNTPAPVLKQAAPQLSLSDLVDSGRAEGMLHGTVAGAGAGFLAAATLFSTTRTNQSDSLPWLLASPAVGAIGGAVGSFFLLQNTRPDAGDIALSASTMWTGATEGFFLQLAVFDQSPDVSTVPLRFATVLGGGVLGLGAGLGLSPFVDATPGDVAVANSALVWGGVLTGFGLATLTSARVQLTTPQVSFALLTGSLVPYGVALACHPLLDIERWPSWLIEAGGAGGMLVSAAFIAVVASSTSVDGAVGFGFVGAGTAAGVVAGGTAAYFVSKAAHDGTAGEPAERTASLAPTVLVDDERRAVPGLAVRGRF